jgi:hypothetical protein
MVDYLLDRKSGYLSVVILILRVELIFRTFIVNFDQ